jgi:hypothetical protein
VNEDTKVKSAIRTYRQHSIYNHPRSVEQRRPPRSPNEVDHVSSEWQRARQAVVDENRREGAQIERTFREEIAKDTLYHAGQGDDVYARQREEHLRKGQERLAEVDRRYEPKLEEAAKRNAIE